MAADLRAQCSVSGLCPGCHGILVIVELGVLSRMEDGGSGRPELGVMLPPAETVVGVTFSAITESQ